jgi:hypothetical protein
MGSVPFFNKKMQKYLYKDTNSKSNLSIRLIIFKDKHKDSNSDKVWHFYEKIIFELHRWKLNENFINSYYWNVILAS